MPMSMSTATPVSGVPLAAAGSRQRIEQGNPAERQDLAERTDDLIDMCKIALLPGLCL
jgi:hypothetical protein